MSLVIWNANKQTSIITSVMNKRLIVSTLKNKRGGKSHFKIDT